MGVQAKKAALAASVDFAAFPFLLLEARFSASLRGMKPRLTAVLMMLVCAFAPAVRAGGKADTKAALAFHMETDATDNPKMIFAQEANGKTRYFRRMPEITSKDVLSFNPFPSDAEGDDYGVAFKLNDNAARRFAAITALNQGRWLFSQINGRVAGGVLIDKQIDDGIVVIWSGATLADIKTFDAALPRFGQEGKKKKKEKKPKKEQAN